MKKHFAQTRPAAAVIVLAALLASPFALHAANDAALPTVPAAPVAPAATDVATIDLNRADAVNLRLQTKTVTESVEAATYALRDPAISLARRGVDDGRAITATVRAGARILADGTREEVEQAVEKAEQARQRLNGAISLATDSTESRWSDLRKELAERYEQYAEALEDAREEAVDGGVRFESRTPLPSTPDAPRT